MRITQGSFSFLPDLTDEQITAQVQYCLDKGWAVNIEFTDDPHPRNTYWEMWGLPMFDLQDAAGVMMELAECRKVYGDRYIRVCRPSTPATAGRSVRLSFIVNRPEEEPASASSGRRSRGRAIRYTTRPMPPTARRVGATAEARIRPATTPYPLPRRPDALLRRCESGGGAFFLSKRGFADADVRRRAATERRSARGAREPSASRTCSTQLDRELIGLAPVKKRIREIAALLLVERVAQAHRASRTRRRPCT